MDTSETYIKMMCEAWDDLRDNMPIGSLIFNRRLRMLYILDGEIVTWREGVNTSNYERAIPLLEQDQLQEMVFQLREPAIAMITILSEFMKKEKPRQMFTSMEQLWLAFVMKEKVGKVWEGEQWKIYEKD